MPRATFTAPAHFLACGLLLLFAASPFNAAHSASAADSIAWMTDYSKAAEIAARERKLLLLHFYSDDCAPCRKLEANVFPRPEVAAAIHAAYVPVKVNVDRTPELARKYQVSRFPLDVVVTPNWLEVHRAVSWQDPAKYVAMLNDTAARSGSALARKPSPAQSSARPVAHEQQVDLTSEFQSPVVENGPEHKPQAAATQPQAKPQASAVARPQYNPYTPTSGDARYTAGPKPTADSLPAPPTMGRPQYETDYAPAVPTPSKPATNAAGYAAEPAPAVRPQPNPHVAPPTPAPSAEKKAAVLPPIGMDGFCVITLAEKRVWTKGDKRYGAIHRGRLYLFASGEAQKTFLGDPDRFSPALSGYDAVVFAETGKLVDGQRAHGLAYNNQMYLFASEEALKKFEATPAPFADTVYQALLKSDNGTKLR